MNWEHAEARIPTSSAQCYPAGTCTPAAGALMAINILGAPMHADDALTPDDTAEYLRYRLKRAGVEREIFTADAVALLHEAASGGMRDLDRLATGCLREAARKKRKLVERDPFPPRHRQRPPRARRVIAWGLWVARRRLVAALVGPPIKHVLRGQDIQKGDGDEKRTGGT